MIQIKNLEKDPAGKKRRNPFRGDTTQLDSGLWQYAVSSGYDKMAIPIYGTMNYHSQNLPVGSYIYVAWSAQSSEETFAWCEFEYAQTELLENRGAYHFLLSKITQAQMHSFWVSGTVTLVHMGAYSQHDGEVLLSKYHAGELAEPWFDGDTKPK